MMLGLKGFIQMCSFAFENDTKTQTVKNIIAVILNNAVQKQTMRERNKGHDAKEALKMQ